MSRDLEAEHDFDVEFGTALSSVTIPIALGNSAYRIGIADSASAGVVSAASHPQDTPWTKQT